MRRLIFVHNAYYYRQPHPAALDARLMVAAG